MRSPGFSPLLDCPSPTAAVLVAHPDDETLWAGGTILMHPSWHWSVFTLCRASDPDRAPRFREAVGRFGASGRMADLDDGPEQIPLDDALVRQTILDFLGGSDLELLLTHAPRGEYTWHRRHAEIFSAVESMWRDGGIRTRQLWLFAYEDGNGMYFPRAIDAADIRLSLPQAVWDEKHRIIREVYGFSVDSWEARTTPRVEAFRRFRSPAEMTARLGARERRARAPVHIAHRPRAGAP